MITIPCLFKNYIYYFDKKTENIGFGNIQFI